MGPELLIAGGLAAASGLGGLVVIETLERHRTDGSRQTLRLRFGRDVTPEVVSGLLDRVSGMHHHTWLVLLDLVADERGVSHYLSADHGTLDSLRGSLHALAPSLRLQPATGDDRQPVEYGWGRVIRLKGGLRVLRQGSPAATSAGLLAALQPLGRGERLLLRWVIPPGRAVAVPVGRDGKPLPAEQGRLLRIKNEGAVINGRALVAVAASDRHRAEHLLARVVSVLRSCSTAHGQLRSSHRSGRALTALLGKRRFVFSDRYATSELAGLLGWPIDAPALPGVNLGTSPLLLPSDRLPRTGRPLGVATWPGRERRIAQPVLGGLSHTLVAGPTGVGKSTLLTNLMTVDIASGKGLVLVDGKGDTATALLSRIPEQRRGDVTVIDLAEPGAQPGLRLFRGGGGELAADVVLGVLADLFRDSWGPLSERYLRAGLVAVNGDPTGTLADVPYVFTDPAYRRMLAGRVRDPLTGSTLAALDVMKPGERQQQLAAPLNKLGMLLGRGIVRTVLGQADAKLDLTAAIRERRIVVVSLAPARVGASAARLIGALFVFALFQAIQARSRLAESARFPLFVYIDEPKALGDLPMPLDALLEQARSLGAGLVLAPQSVSQLPKAVREAALTNVATRVVFRQHADDARLLARDLPGVTPEHLGDLAAYEAIARIGLGPGDVAAPVSIKTNSPGKPFSNPRDLQRASAARWGMSLDEVDAALTAN